MRIGSIIGERYELIEQIASGGMGRVFRARHLVSERLVALKVLHEHIASRPDSIRRFRREASLASKVEHPGLVQVLDAGADEKNKTFYIAMELLQGQDFRDWLDGPSRSVSKGVEFVLDLLVPLTALHAQGLVHRDLKPENVFLSRQAGGEVQLKILDFGIARSADVDRFTASGVGLGTPHYMAPEQVMHANRATAATDVWAVGVMLYEAVSGTTPFIGETPEALLVAACTKPHIAIETVWPEVPEALAAVISGCLEKDPEKRIQDGSELHRRLLIAMSEDIVRDEHDVTAFSVRLVESAEFRMLGTELAGELEQGCMARLTSIARHFGASGERVSGRGLTAFFTSDATGEDDDPAGRACACALQMQIKMNDMSNWSLARGGCELRIVAGVAAGRAVIERVDGVAVSQDGISAAGILRQAERVQALARPGQVAITPGSRAMVKAALEVEETREVTADEFRHPVSLTFISGIGMPFAVYVADAPSGEAWPMSSHPASIASSRETPSFVYHDDDDVQSVGIARTWEGSHDAFPPLGVSETGTTESAEVLHSDETTADGVSLASSDGGSSLREEVSDSSAEDDLDESGVSPAATTDSVWGKRLLWGSVVSASLTLGAGFGIMLTNHFNVELAEGSRVAVTLEEPDSGENESAVAERPVERPSAPDEVAQVAEAAPEQASLGADARRFVEGQWAFELPRGFVRTESQGPMAASFAGAVDRRAVEVELFSESFAGQLDVYRASGDALFRRQADIVDSGSRLLGGVPGYRRVLQYADGRRVWQMVSVFGGEGSMLQCQASDPAEWTALEAFCGAVVSSLRAADMLGAD